MQDFPTASQGMRPKPILKSVGSLTNIADINYPLKQLTSAAARDDARTAPTKHTTTEAQVSTVNSNVERKIAPQRCRQCGNDYTSTNPNTGGAKYPIPILKTEPGHGNLRNQKGNMAHDHCNVNLSFYATGYPLAEGKLHPRKKKKQRRQGNKA